jgi:PAS domain-containing protein
MSDTRSSVAEPSAHEPSRPGPGRRDVLLVGVVLLVLFTLGLVTDAYDRLEPSIRGSNFGDEAFAVAILLLGGATFLAVREAHAARKLAGLQTEAAARATAVEERYRSLVERLPIVAYAWDSSFPAGTGPADYISPQIESLFGVTAESWQQDPGSWEARVHPDDVSAVLAAWEEATVDGSPFTAEYRIRDAAGSWRWVRDEANPVGPGVNGAPVYLGAARRARLGR